MQQDPGVIFSTLFGIALFVGACVVIGALLIKRGEKVQEKHLKNAKPGWCDRCDKLHSLEDVGEQRGQAQQWREQQLRERRPTPREMRREAAERRAAAEYLAEQKRKPLSDAGLKFAQHAQTCAEGCRESFGGLGGLGGPPHFCNEGVSIIRGHEVTAEEVEQFNEIMREAEQRRTGGRADG